MCIHKVADGPERNRWLGPPHTPEKMISHENKLKSKSQSWNAAASTAHVNRLSSCWGREFPSPVCLNAASPSCSPLGLLCVLCRFPVLWVLVLNAWQFAVGMCHQAELGRGVWAKSEGRTHSAWAWITCKLEGAFVSDYHWLCLGSWSKPECFQEKTKHEWALLESSRFKLKSF